MTAAALRTNAVAMAALRALWRLALLALAIADLTASSSIIQNHGKTIQ
jgi:hypothetical protein